MGTRPLQRPAKVAFQPWRPHLLALVVTCAALVGILIGVAYTAFAARGPLAGQEYHLWRWEADHLLDNVFARLGIGPDPNDAQGEAAVRQYFRLTTEIRAAEAADPPNLQLIETLSNERANYGNDVEQLIERYINEAVRKEGLQRSLPLFGDVRFTWPPVDFELTSPPQVLVRSPRNVIRREGDSLLKPGLTLRDVERIEAVTSNADTVTLVVPIGGLAAYPAMVQDDRSYDAILDTASHEWAHHYLAFFPLGEQWGKGGDAETLNETTANVFGRELASLIRTAHPITLPADANGAAPAGPPVTVDFGKEMRQLRLDVDHLLSEGRIDQAEQLMEEKRKYLEAHGITIRKLNQAYFAFYGTYADTPASSNPIGPKIERVWELTQDVGSFMRVMREVTSTAALDRALAALEAASAH
ncbi:MAG: hypothetical protein IT304_03175 [Dehalococcoidia bacterium]|nr:hypothetical protein [Dehalococcoidia bacterium]